MLIELGTDRVSNLKRRTFKSVQGAVAGLLGLVGTYSISPNIVRAEITSSPPAKTSLVTSRVVLSESDPNIYVTCGGEGYLDNESVLVVEEDESTYTESLGIIPGECGNPLPQEESSLIVETILPTPTPVPTPTTIVFPRYPQIPLPTPNPAITKRPEIKGDAECVRQTNATADLLQQKLPQEYYFFIFHTGKVVCIESGNGKAWPGATPPTIELPRVLREDKISYAGGLVHESCHIWQSRRFKEMYPGMTVPFGIHDGKEAEEECYNIQYQTQKRLGDHPENLRLFIDFYYQRFGIIIYNP